MAIAAFIISFVALRQRKSPFKHILTREQHMKNMAAHGGMDLTPTTRK